jgi:hypothetical protein
MNSSISFTLGADSALPGESAPKTWDAISVPDAHAKIKTITTFRITYLLGIVGLS